MKNINNNCHKMLSKLIHFKGLHELNIIWRMKEDTAKYFQVDKLQQDRVLFPV